MQRGVGNFWTFIDNFYLRKPSDEQIQRLGVLRSMLQSAQEDSSPFDDDSINELVLKETLEPHFESQMHPLQLANLLKHISISQNLLLTGSNRKHWKTIDKIMRLKEASIPTRRKSSLQQLRNQQQQLDAIIGELGPSEENDDILQEINRLKEQWGNLNEENKDGLSDLQNKVRQEIKSNRVIFIINRAQSRAVGKRGRPKLVKVDEKVASRHWDLSDPKSRLEVQQQFIQYAFVDIERKIIAESMSKIVSTKKYKNGVKFEVVFEEAAKLQSMFLDENELFKFNRLKELSLLKFYKVSGKCRYGNICQNIGGFNHMHRNPKEPNRLKDITTQETISRLINKTFANFDICHNCQELYHEAYLVGCNYRVIRPKWENENPHAPRHKDLYVAREGVFICLRKYCRHCLNNSYVNRKKNGLCPFCQEICYCPRCQKQSILNRLKDIYQTSGGDVSKLDKLSIIRPLKKRFIEAQIQRKKSQKEPMEMNSMESLRDQMQECRQICQMIKRREKQKLKLVDSKKDLFERNLDFFRQGGFLKRELPITENKKEGDAYRVYWEQRGKLKKLK